MITLKATNEQKLLPDGIPAEMGKVGVRMFGRRFLTDKQFAKLVECAEKNTVYRYEKKEETIKLLKDTSWALSEIELPAYSNKHMSAGEISKYAEGVKNVEKMLLNVDACAKEARMDNGREEPQLHYRTYGYERGTVAWRIKQFEEMLKEQTAQLPDTEKRMADLKAVRN